VNFALISTCPLYSIIFYSRENSVVYVYSINGQFLDSICEKGGFADHMHVLKCSDFSECLVLML
jgi:hypothetical protein